MLSFRKSFCFVQGQREDLQLLRCLEIFIKSVILKGNFMSLFVFLKAVYHIHRSCSSCGT